MLKLNASKAASSRIVGLLDVGTSKICCAIASLEPAKRNDGDVAGGVAGALVRPRPTGLVPRIIGFGHQRSRGIKAGVIIDVEEAELAIRAAVSQAERSAGIELKNVHLGVSCGRLRSSNFAASAPVGGAVVRDDDVERVMQAGRTFAERDGRSLLHMNVIGYRLDGTEGIRDPRGLAGRKLGMDLHAVTADETPLRNFLLVLERSYLGVAALVASPFASAIAATTEEERQVGVVLIDMGGGKTSYSVFAEGHFLHTDAIAIGGEHVTIDISRALSTPLTEAERIKALYGTMVSAASDSHEVISFPVVGQTASEEEQMLYQTTKAQLHQILRPRVESTLKLIMERVERSGFGPHAGNRVVLTGGAAQLVGLSEFTANLFGKAVRVSQPAAFAGMPSGFNSPAFSNVIGLLQAAMDPASGALTYQDREGLKSGYAGRVGRWLRESF